jgi:hypothetical protein
VQDKVSAAMLSVPIASADAHMFLKLNPRDFKHLVENEDSFLAAALHADIETVDANLVRDSDGEPGLAVRRFDRVTVDGGLRSLAVEDGCQVLGIYPASKYSVTIEAVLARLSSVCEAPVPAAADFLRQAAFAYLTSNGDAHAKNFSVLQDASGRWQPSPAYDLPSSYPYGDTTMALSISGKRDGNIPGTRFVALGGELGLPARAARTIIEHVAASADRWIDGLDDLPFDKGVTIKLKRVIRNRQAMLSVEYSKRAKAAAGQLTDVTPGQSSSPRTPVRHRGGSRCARQGVRGIGWSRLHPQPIAVGCSATSSTTSSRRSRPPSMTGATASADGRDAVGRAGSWTADADRGDYAHWNSGPHATTTTADQTAYTGR